MAESDRLSRPSTRDDVLTVIRRWAIRNPPVHSDAQSCSVRSLPPSPRVAMLYVGDVEVVPADAYRGAVVPDDEDAIERAERWIASEMHEGMSNREVAAGVLRAAAGGGQ